VTERDVSLREYVDVRLHGMQDALVLARAELDRRLEDMNQFREENRRQASHSVSRDVHDSDIGRLEALIAVEREARQRAEGSLSTWRFIALFLGLPGVVALLLQLVAASR